MARNLASRRGTRGSEDVTFYLRDYNHEMVQNWERVFKEFDNIKMSEGDIFTDAPPADAIVAPANNSFGFMESVIETKCKMLYGEQLQSRLQQIIRTEHNGELLVGQAVILPTFAEGAGQPKFLVSAPTMRVQHDISETVNSYLTFRAVILSVLTHNSMHSDVPIRSVLCPGIGTATGSMPKGRCALQMRKAYETFVQGKHSDVTEPPDLQTPYEDHEEMSKYWR